MRVTNRNLCSIIPRTQLRRQVDFAETTETQKVLHTLSQCCLSSCLLRGLSSCFCSCSVWYAATSVHRSRSLMAVAGSPVCSFIYSVSGDQDCIIISSDLLLARIKTCCQSRSNGHYRTRNGQTERKSTVQLSAQWKN